MRRATTDTRARTKLAAGPARPTSTCPNRAAAATGDRDRPAPAEAGHDQGDGAQRVEVGERVEGQPTLGAGRLVALEAGHGGVAELVEGDAHDDRDHERREQLRVVAEPEQR